MLASGVTRGNTLRVKAPTQLKALSTAHLAPAPESEFLLCVGRRVRELRERSGVSRRVLARQADVSERYLGQLEAGAGNISIVLLRRVAVALDVPIRALLESETDQTEQRAIRRLLKQIPRHRMADLVARLEREIGTQRDARCERIALIGLRGAGKSTLGARLAQERGVPFVEMDRLIEADSGLPLAELFSLYGLSGYRRFEGRCLRRVIKDYPRAVLSVGGGVVSESGTYESLLANCFTVWLKARPEEHMQRVIAQGDMRPMAESSEAMEDLKRILAAREPQYQKADEILDTSGMSVETAFARLREIIARP